MPAPRGPDLAARTSTGCSAAQAALRGASLQTARRRAGRRQRRRPPRQSAVRPGAPGAHAEPPTPAGASRRCRCLPEPRSRARPDWPTLIRALDFPRDADDQEGFRALRAALRHHGLAQMLQAAEDVLTLLSQEGVYVDDLRCRAGATPRPGGGSSRGDRGAEVAGGRRHPRPSGRSRPRAG